MRPLQTLKFNMIKSGSLLYRVDSYKFNWFVNKS